MPSVLVEQNPSPMKLEVMGVEDWPLRVEPVGELDALADDAGTSYIVRGEATLQAADEDPVTVGEGDLVVILPGTCCRWTITKEIERHHANG